MQLHQATCKLKRCAGLVYYTYQAVYSWCLRLSPNKYQVTNLGSHIKIPWVWSFIQKTEWEQTCDWRGPNIGGGALHQLPNTSYSDICQENSSVLCSCSYMLRSPSLWAPRQQSPCLQIPASPAEEEAFSYYFLCISYNFSLQADRVTCYFEYHIFGIVNANWYLIILQRPHATTL